MVIVIYPRMIIPVNVARTRGKEVIEEASSVTNRKYKFQSYAPNFDVKSILPNLILY